MATTAGELRLARNQLHRLPKWILDKAVHAMQGEYNRLQARLYALPEGPEKEKVRLRRAQVAAIQRQFTGWTMSGDVELVVPVVEAAKAYLAEVATSALPSTVRSAIGYLVEGEGLGAVAVPIVIAIAVALILIAVSVVVWKILETQDRSESREFQKETKKPPVYDKKDPFSKSPAKVPWALIGGVGLLLAAPSLIRAARGK